MVLFVLGLVILGLVVLRMDFMNGRSKNGRSRMVIREMVVPVIVVLFWYKYHGAREGEWNSQLANYRSFLTQISTNDCVLKLQTGEVL
jgi:hypothetical protein